MLVLPERKHLLVDWRHWLEPSSKDHHSFQPSSDNFELEPFTNVNSSNSTTIDTWPSSGFLVKLVPIFELSVCILDYYWELEDICKSWEEYDLELWENRMILSPCTIFSMLNGFTITLEMVRIILQISLEWDRWPSSIRILPQTSCSTFRISPHRLQTNCGQRFSSQCCLLRSQAHDSRIITIRSWYRVEWGGSIDDYERRSYRDWNCSNDYCRACNLWSRSGSQGQAVYHGR